MTSALRRLPLLVRARLACPRPALTMSPVSTRRIGTFQPWAGTDFDEYASPKSTADKARDFFADLEEEEREKFAGVSDVGDVGRKLTLKQRPPPPVLLRLREHLKTAMQARDVTRLAVIRSVLTTVGNAPKHRPVKTDAAMVTILRKYATDGEDAASEAEKQGRPEIAEEERKQVDIAQKYIEESGLEEPDRFAVHDAVEKLVSGIPLDQYPLRMAKIMKSAMAPDGPFEGRVPLKADVAWAAKSLAKKYNAQNPVEPDAGKEKKKGKDTGKNKKGKKK